MWYVYRSYRDGEIAENVYDTLIEARRAAMFIEEHFDADEVTVSTTWKISPVGGLLYVEPKVAPHVSWFSRIAKYFSRNSAVSS